MTKPMTAAQAEAKQASRRKNRARWPSSPLNANGPEWGKVEAGPPPEIAVGSAKSGLSDLLSIMRDTELAMRVRLSAGISASRVSPLSLRPGEPEPEAVRFSRWITDAEFDRGERFSAEFRREAAQSLAYWERRRERAELQFAVPDTDEKRRAWVRLVNGGLRTFLSKRGRWPQDKRVLLTAADDIDLAGLPDPELVLSAVCVGPQNRHERRRARAIDEPIAGTWSGTEEQRLELIRPLAAAVLARLSKFGLASKTQHADGHDDG
jgi:hypothetical protein